MNFIEANGVSLRYAVEGAGKPIVLIHEMGGSMESWSLVAQILAAKRRVVRYDTRGAGFSEKIRGPLTIDTMTDDLIALLDGLGISEKVALAGTAVGGAIALHTAFRFPGSRRGGGRDQPGDLHAAREPCRDACARRRIRTQRRARRLRGDRRRTAIRRSCAATGTASRPGVRAGSPTIRRASRRSTACFPTPTSRRSCRRSNARCW